MWRPRLPRRNPERYIGAGPLVGLPALVLIFSGAPPIETAIGAVVIGGFLALVH